MAKITSTGSTIGSVKVSSTDQTTLVKKITVGVPVRGVVGALAALNGLSDVTLASVANGDYLVYDSASSKWINKSEADFTSDIRGYFSASGDLSYDSSTGQFSIDVETVYTKDNFDSDFNTAIDEATLNGTGLSYDSATNTLSITATGVVVGTYGSASEVPVITVNAQGQIDSIGTVSVAGVTSTTYDSASGVLTINTADGNSFATTLHDSDDRISEIETALRSVETDIITTDVMFNLGDSISRWGSLYLNDDIYLGSSTKLSVDGGTAVFTDVLSLEPISINISNNSTTDLAEGDNLYYTTNRHDSDTLAQVTSSYVQDRQIKYTTADFVDSAFVTAQINALIGGAPGTLDTLNEIAAALNDDDSAYATLVGLINDQLDSAEVIDLVDSDYIQLRQDYAYSSLTGVPTNLSQFNNDTNYLDSTTVTSIINLALDSAALGGTGLSYDSATNTLSITDTGVIAGTYGSASEVPVFTVNSQGQLDSAGVVSVAGVSSTSWNSLNNTFTINTADGGSYDTIIDSWNTFQVTPTGINVDGQIDADSARLSNIALHTNSKIYATNSLGNITIDATSPAFPNFAGSLFFKAGGVSFFEIAGSQSVWFDKYGLYNISNLRADSATFDTITRSGATDYSGTYGSASQVPVVTVDSSGFVDSIGSVSVAGVDSAAWDYNSRELSVFTADGQTFTTSIDKFGGSSLSQAGDFYPALNDSSYSISRYPGGSSATGLSVSHFSSQIKLLDGWSSGLATGDEVTLLTLGSLIVTAEMVTSSSFKLFFDDGVEKSSSSSIFNSYEDIWLRATIRVNVGTVFLLVRAENFPDTKSANGALTHSYVSESIDPFVGSTWSLTVPSWLELKNVILNTGGITGIDGSSYIVTPPLSWTSSIDSSSLSSVISYINTDVPTETGIHLTEQTAIAFGDSGSFSTAEGSLYFDEFYNNFNIDFPNNDVYITTPNLISQGSIKPHGDNLLKLGDSDKNWKELYAIDATFTNVTRASTVDSATYGSASQVPVLTVNSSGFIDSIGSVSVAGVSSTSYDSATGVFTINTADGGAFATTFHDSDDRITEIRNALSANGDLTYNPSTGVFEFDVEEVYTKANFDSDLGDANTGQLPEGSNLYYTTARADSDAKNAISVTDAGGDGSLSYSAANGEITYTGPSASEVRAHFSNGTGVTITSGEIAIGQDVGTTSDVTFAKITGDSAVIDGVSFNATPGTYAGGNTPGTLFWDSDEQKGLTFVTRTLEGFAGATINVGQENVIYVHNQTGETVSNGDVVYISGTAHGLHPSITKAQANAAVSGNIAVATHDIVDNAHGYVTTFGLVRDVNTDGLVAGDDIYLSKDSAGKWTTTEVSIDEGYPYHVGKVVRVDASTGTILVNPFREHLEYLRLEEQLRVDGAVRGDSFSVGEIAFRTNFHDSHIPFEEGALWYDPHHKNLNYYTDFDHPIEVGMQVVERVYNNTGSTILKGQPLYYSGNRTDVAGQESPTVALANATSSTKYNVQGLAAEDIPINSYGQIVVAGVIDGFDTSGLNAGQNFFAGLTDGAVQNAPPTYPNYPMCLGWVIKSDATDGKVIINQQNHSVNSFRVQGNTHISANLVIDGDLTVAGTQTITSTENVQIGGNIQYLNAGNTIGEAGTNFSGSGLDDAFFAGHYSGDSSTKQFYVEIDSAGATDTFEWGFDSLGTPEATGVVITGAEQELAAGIKIDFGATTGHTLGDKWTGTATATNVDTGLFSNKNEGDGGNGYTHVGVYWDATENEWTFVGQYDSEPEAPINRSAPTFQYGDVRGKDFYGTTFNGALSGNASTATALASAQNFSLTGDITATAVSFNGTGAVQLTTAYNPGSIVNDDINASAAIADTKLATISTSGKVQNSATTATSANTASAIVARDASGNFSAGTITATLSGNASTATEATNVTVSANNTTDETVYLTFVDGATGTQGIETDTGLTYNPSSGLLTTAELEIDDLNPQITFKGDDGIWYRVKVNEATNRLELGHSTNVALELSNAGQTRVNGDLIFADSNDLNLPDKSKILIGDDNDLQIEHNGTNSQIKNYNGVLQILQLNDNSDITLNTDDGSGGTTPYFRADGSTGEAILYHYGSEKFATKSTGVTVTGEVIADSATISGQGIIGGDGSTNGVIINSGQIEIRSDSDPAFIDFYCEVSNAHRTRVKSAAHSEYSGQVEITLPTSSGTFALTSDLPTLGTDFLDSTTVLDVIDSAYIKTVNYLDNERLTFGDANDLQIYSNGTNSIIAEVGTGDLVIQGANIRLENGSGEYYLRTYTNGKVELYYNNSKKLETTSTGVDVTGQVVADSATITNLTLNGEAVDSAWVQARQVDLQRDSAFIKSVNYLDSEAIIFGTGNDASIYYGADIDATVISATTNLILQGSNLDLKGANNETYVHADVNGGVELYYDNTKKVETTAKGITVSGGVIADSAVIAGLNYPVSDGSSGQFLKTDGSGNLSFATVSGSGGGGLDSSAVLDLIDSDYVVARATGTVLIDALDVNTYQFITSSPTTSISGADKNGSTLSFYNAANTQVYLNGVLLVDSDDYSADTGTNTITLTSATDSNDNVTITTYEKQGLDLTGISQLSATVDSTGGGVVDTYSATSYRTAKITAEVMRGSAVQAQEILITHNGTTAYMTTYAVINSDSDLGAFSVDLTGGDVRLSFTPTTNATHTIKTNFVRTEV